MKAKTIQWLAMILIVETGLIHYLNAQDGYEKAAVLGFLFLANFLGALVAAYGIYRNRIWGWMLGLSISLAAILGYSWSRTIGLPGLETEGWLAPWGVVSLVVESLFILLLLFRPWRIIDQASALTPPSNRLRYLLPVASLFTVILISLGTYRWQATSKEMGVRQISSAEEIARIPVTSSSEVQQQYGIMVTQAAVSLLDGIVDVRIKVLDPDKAHQLLDYPAAIFVDQQTLIPAPYLHSHANIKPGQIYVMFFPTQKNTVRRGSEISLVFDNLRVEPVIVK